MKKERIYPIRYKIEDWGKFPEGTQERVAPGILVNDSDYGYSDRILVASVLLDEKGNAASILLVDSATGEAVDASFLTMVRDYIDHYLEKHI